MGVGQEYWAGMAYLASFLANVLEVLDQYRLMECTQLVFVSCFRFEFSGFMYV